MRVHEIGVDHRDLVDDERVDRVEDLAGRRRTGRSRCPAISPIGRRNSEWIVWPSTLSAATPVGAQTAICFDVFHARCCSSVDLPVPGAPGHEHVLPRVLDEAEEGLLLGRERRCVHRILTVATAVRPSSAGAGPHGRRATRGRVPAALPRLASDGQGAESAVPGVAPAAPRSRRCPPTPRHPSTPPAPASSALSSTAIWVIVGVLLLAAVGAGVAMYRELYSPAAFVERYLGMLADGRAADALRCRAWRSTPPSSRRPVCPPPPRRPAARDALATLSDIEIVSETAKTAITLVDVRVLAPGAFPATTTFARAERRMRSASRPRGGSRRARSR